MKPLWQAIWSLHVPAKVKNLVWKACRDALPSKANLVRRKVIEDATCDLCHECQEDVLHAYKCPKLMEFWKENPKWQTNYIHKCKSFFDIMEFLIVENRDPALFSMTAWVLWNRRNNLCLGKPIVVLSQVLKEAKERLQEFSQQPNPAPPTMVRPETCWRPPDKSWFKVNFDGALFCQEHRAGIGVVIRNEEGAVIASLSQQIHLPSTVLEVETMATRRALEFAMEIGVHKVIL